LALGIDGVEGERGLARPRKTREYDQLVARDGEIDVLEVVLARAADDDGPPAEQGLDGLGVLRRPTRARFLSWSGHGGFLKGPLP
jgi:hypothetical protein